MSFKRAFETNMGRARQGRAPSMRASAEKGQLDDGRSRVAYRLVGLNLDQAPTEIAVERLPGEQPKFRTQWTGAQNIRVRHGARERMGGWTPVHTAGWTAANAGAWIRFAAEQTAPYWLVWGPTSLYVSDGSTWNVVHVEALPDEPAGIWGFNLENHMVLGHSAGVARGIDFRGGVPASADQLPDWPATWSTRCMGHVGPYLVACGMKESGIWYEDRVRWSHPFDPGELPLYWVPAADNLAGDATLAGVGPFRAALGLRRGIAIYRDRETWVGNYVGPPYVFDFGQRPVFSDRGCAGNGAVAAVGGRHFVVSDGDFGVHDGVNWVSLADGKTRRWLQGRMAPEWPNSGLGRLVFVAPWRELWYGVAEEDGWIREALVYSLDDNEFTVRQLTYPSQAMDVGNIASAVVGQTWDADAAQWDSDVTVWSQGGEAASKDKPMFSAGELSPGATADAQLQLRAYEISTFENGFPMGWTLERRSLDLGDPSAVDNVLEVWPRIEGDAELGWVSVRMGTQMSDRESVTWGPTQVLTPPNNMIEVDVSGRYISIEIGSASSNTSRIEGFDLVYVRKGRGG